MKSLNGRIQRLEDNLSTINQRKESVMKASEEDRKILKEIARRLALCLSRQPELDRGNENINSDSYWLKKISKAVLDELNEKGALNGPLRSE